MMLCAAFPGGRLLAIFGETPAGYVVWFAHCHMYVYLFYVDSVFFIRRLLALLQATALGYEITRRLSRQHAVERRLRRDIQRQFGEIEELRRELRREKERSEAMEARLHKEAGDKWRDGFEACREIAQSHWPHMDFSVVQRVQRATAVEKGKDTLLEADDDEDFGPTAVEPYCRRTFWSRGLDLPPSPPPEPLV
ncbi:hypothetical protein U1Q18_052758 [Sarracenia purpurea var. burkii]